MNNFQFSDKKKTKTRPSGKILDWCIKWQSYLSWASLILETWSQMNLIVAHKQATEATLTQGKYHLQVF